MEITIRPSPAATADHPRIKHPGWFVRSFDGSYSYPVERYGNRVSFEFCSCVQCHELRIASISAAIERELAGGRS